MKTHCETAEEDVLVGPANDLYVKAATIEPVAEEEVIFFLRDKAPTIKKLLRLKPLQLNSRVGSDRNPFGPVVWIVFWLGPAYDPDMSVVSHVKCLNPQSETELALWRRLAKQDSWRLFLVSGDKMRDYFTFNNRNDRFELGQNLESMVKARASVPMVDPVQAKETFLKQNSIKDLLNLPDGHCKRYLMLTKSELGQMTEEEFLKRFLNPKSGEIGKVVTIPVEDPEEPQGAPEQENN
jgi:hypothetical protein